VSSFPLLHPDILSDHPPREVVASAALLFVFRCPGSHRSLHSFPTRRSSDLVCELLDGILLLFHRCVEPETVEHPRHSDRVGDTEDRKSTRLNSSHVSISYAVFCLTKKTSPGPRPT